VIPVTKEEPPLKLELFEADLPPTADIPPVEPVRAGLARVELARAELS